MYKKRNKISFFILFILIFNMIFSNLYFLEANAEGFIATNVKDGSKVIKDIYKAKNNFKYRDYTTVAFDFHIFSNETNLIVHTNGNIATKTLNANGQAFGTHQSTNLNLKEENYFQTDASGINNINSDGIVVIGNSVKTEITDNGNKVCIGENGQGLQNIEVYKENTKTNNYINLDDEFSKLKTISKLFSLNQTSNGVHLSNLEGGKQKITVDGNSSFYYLNVKANEINSEDQKREINIIIPEDQALIVNVDMAGIDKNKKNTCLSKLVTTINNHGSNEFVVGQKNPVLWNLYDSSRSDRLFVSDGFASVGISDHFMGSILAPSASIKYGALNGSVIANKTKSNGQESHKWDFTGEEIEDNKKDDINEISVSIEAKKNLEGKKLEVDMFRFEIVDKSGNVVSEGKNDKEGNIKFSPINYTKSGTYNYKVREVKGNLEGISYDDHVFGVQVIVTDDGKGNLIAKVNKVDGDIVFTNRYNAKETSVSIEAEKNLIGKELKADMFKFEIVDESGNVVSEGKNDKDGKIIFNPINYAESGTHNYTVREVNNGLKGISYDTKTFNVKVIITDDGEGNLLAKVEKDQDIVFNNEYNAKAVSVSIEAKKNLEGKKLEANMFKFEIVDESGNVVSEGKNDKDGKIIFNEIKYTEAGTYNYTVREVKGDLEGISYDTKTFNVKVIVTDDGEGNLLAKVEKDQDIVFVNEYKSENKPDENNPGEEKPGVDKPGENKPGVDKNESYENTKVDIPKTGFEGNSILGGLALISLGSCLLINRKKNNK